MTGFQTSDRHQTGRSLCLIDSASPLRMNDFNFHAAEPICSNESLMQTFCGIRGGCKLTCEFTLDEIKCPRGSEQGGEAPRAIWPC